MRTYSKDSFIAKIVCWYYGYLPSSNTCDVRKIVLFLAPWKLITNPRVFGRDWPIGLVWAQVLVIWVAMFSGWAETDGGLLILYSFVIAILVLEVIALSIGILTIAMAKVSDSIEGVTAPIRSSDFVHNAKSFVADALDSIYSKVCKKVEWK